MYKNAAAALVLGTIQILRKHVLGDFLTHPPTHSLCAVIKQKLPISEPTLCTQSSAHVIFEWFLTENHRILSQNLIFENHRNSLIRYLIPSENLA